jgi:hypothetical protein
MFRNKLSALAGAVVFLLIALVALYRLLFWFPITVGGQTVGQTVSFFIFVVFIALAMIAFKDLRSGRP